MNGGLQLIVKKFDGTDWMPVGPAVKEGEGSLSFKFPYIAYYSGYKVIVKKFDGTDWELLGSFSGGTRYYSSYEAGLDYNWYVPFVALLPSDIYFPPILLRFNNDDTDKVFQQIAWQNFLTLERGNC